MSLIKELSKLYSIFKTFQLQLKKSISVGMRPVPRLSCQPNLFIVVQDITPAKRTFSGNPDTVNGKKE